MTSPPHRAPPRGNIRREATVRSCAAAALLLALTHGAAATPALEKNSLIVGETPTLTNTRTGSVAVPAGIRLVNVAGYTASGTLTEGTMFGGGLDLSVAETRELMAGNAGMAADPRAAWSDRRAVILRSQPARQGPLDLGMTASLLESGDRSLDPDTARWVSGTRNRAYGGGATLGLWDGRVRLANELAWSQQDEIARETTVRLDETQYYARAQHGRAQRHRLDVDLLRTGDAVLAGYGMWSRAEPDYFAPQGDAPADRETQGGGLRFGWDILTLELGQISFRNNLDPAPGALTLRDSTTTAALSLSLDRYRPAFRPGEAPSIGALLPSTLTVRHQAGTVRGLPEDSLGSFADVTDRKRTHDALSLDWRWRDALTVLTLARTGLDSRQPGFETADSVDRALTLTQSFTPDGWTASLAVTLGENEGLETGNRSHAARQALNAALTTILPQGPALSATFGVNRNEVMWVDTGELNANSGWEAVAAADFSALVFDGLEADSGRFALMVGVKGADPNAGDAGLQRVDLRYGLQAAFSF
ncbi:MAG: hypothetical protein GEU92_10420 [Alphaproteobacteria bacterium]|nr:hypothetical protein [Alphaproteobacteria bacterium]